jgi:hypothetical protein
VLPDAGVDALDPQSAESALAGTPVAIGVLQAFLDPLDGGAKDVLVAAAVTLGLLDDFAVTGDMMWEPRALRIIFWGRLRIPWRLQA